MAETPTCDSILLCSRLGVYRYCKSAVFMRGNWTGRCFWLLLRRRGFALIMGYEAKKSKPSKNRIINLKSRELFYPQWWNLIIETASCLQTKDLQATFTSVSYIFAWHYAVTLDVSIHNHLGSWNPTVFSFLGMLFIRESPLPVDFTVAEEERRLPLQLLSESVNNVILINPWRKLWQYMN